MKVFNATFYGHYLRGSATIVAETEEQARALLIEELKTDKLMARNDADNDIVLFEVDVTEARVISFENGDY